MAAPVATPLEHAPTTGASGGPRGADAGRGSPATGSNLGPLGLVAGNGVFPRLFAQAAAEAGERVVACALRGEAAPGLEALVAEHHWVGVAQLGQVLKRFKVAGVRRAAFAGGVDKARFFRPQKVDLTTLRLAASLLLKRDDELLRAVAAFFERQGIAIVPSTLYLARALAPAGVLSRRQPSAQQWADLRYGFQCAKEIGRLDIGQALVLKDGVVLAVEALEGTDRCIERGAALGGSGVVVVKVAKPGQDPRFDLPAIGTRTIAGMRALGAAVLGVEASATLLLEPDEVARAADAAGLVLVGLTPADADADADAHGGQHD